MKNLLALSLLTLLTLKGIAQEFKPLEIGAVAPLATTKMKSTDGKEYAIKDVATKKGVLVMFSCNTCPYVGKYQSRTVEVIKEAKAKGVGMIIINSNEAQRNDDDSYQAMQAYAKAHGYENIPYVVDANSALANAFGATRTPECFLFDGSGKLVYHGAIDNNPEAAQANRSHLTMAMNEAISGKDVSVKETRSIGCQIKRR